VVKIVRLLVANDACSKSIDKNQQQQCYECCNFGMKSYVDQCAPLAELVDARDSKTSKKQYFSYKT
jgi:hypothetical protein